MSTDPDDEMPSEASGYQPERWPAGREVVRTPDHSRVFQLIVSYGGLPLSSLDVRQELGIGETRARSILNDLAALGVVNVKDGPDRTRLYYVQEAL